MAVGGVPQATRGVRIVAVERGGRMVSVTLNQNELQVIIGSVGQCGSLVRKSGKSGASSLLPEYETEYLFDRLTALRRLIESDSSEPGDHNLRAKGFGWAFDQAREWCWAAFDLVLLARGTYCNSLIELYGNQYERSSSLILGSTAFSTCYKEVAYSGNHLNVSVDYRLVAAQRSDYGNSGVAELWRLIDVDVPPVVCISSESFERVGTSTEDIVPIASHEFPHPIGGSVSARLVVKTVADDPIVSLRYEYHADPGWNWKPELPQIELGASQGGLYRLRSDRATYIGLVKCVEGVLADIGGAEEYEARVGIARREAQAAPSKLVTYAL